MFKKLNSKLGLTFLIVLALLIVGIAYILYTSDSDDVKSARQNSEGRLVESDDVVVERAGNWTTQEAKSASSGSYLYSSGSPDDVLTLTFVGSRVEVIYTTGSNLGTLAVDVDHTVLRTIITADQTTQYQERTVVDYLEDGLHTLRVYAQEGGVIGIDAFRISRPSTAELAAMPINMTKLGDNVLENAITNGGASIIILLQEPAVHYSNEAVYKENIKQTQQNVLDSLAVGHFEVFHLYKTIPSFAGDADFNAILELQSNSSVKFIHLNSSGGGSTGQSGPAFHVDDVRNLYDIGGQDIVVAVLDSGIDTDHPDLSDAVIAQTCFNRNGDCPPTNTTTSTSAEDEYGHGTEMTGIITGIPLIDVAPNANKKAVPITEDSLF